MSGDVQQIFSRSLHLSYPWKVESVSIDENETRADIKIALEGKVRTLCPHCGSLCRGYDRRKRSWQHSDMFDLKCYIHYDLERMECPLCRKVFTADIPWAEKGCGFTSLFEKKSIALMKEMPVNAAAAYLNVTDKRLWRIMERYVGGRMKEQDLSGLRRFYVDETACRRGRSYVSIFADDNHNIIFVTEGNDSASVKRFREHLESKGGKASDIEYICCDMGKGFQAGIAEEFPEASVTYDRFHVMEHMMMAVDRSRRNASDATGHKGRRCESSDMLGQRFVLLKNHDDLHEYQKIIVSEILSSHAELEKVYRLKESLRRTWVCDSKEDAANHLMSWLLTAEYSGIESLDDITDLVDNHFDEILNWFDSGMNNGVMEGINSVIQAVKSRARGYRDWRNLRAMCYLRGSGLCRSFRF